MKEGKFEEAETFVARAEKLRIEYSLFHLGDTPKKVRADLTTAKRNSRKKSLERPSQKFTPELPPDHVAEPVAQANVKQVAGSQTPRVPSEVRNPASEVPYALPDAQGSQKPLPQPQRTKTAPDDDAQLVTQMPSPTPEHPLPPADNAKLRMQSDAQLLAAHRALAVGDVRARNLALEAAKKVKAVYGPHDDTPQRVEASIRAYTQVTEMSSTRQDDGVRHQMADQLMDQAQQLMRWKDYDEAERLVKHVQAMRVSYGPFEAKPDALLAKISAAHRSETPAAPEAKPPGVLPVRAGREGRRSRAAARSVGPRQSGAARRPLSGRSCRVQRRRRVAQRRGRRATGRGAVGGQLGRRDHSGRFAGNRRDASGLARDSNVPAVVAEAVKRCSSTAKAKNGLKDHDLEGAMDYFRRAFRRARSIGSYDRSKAARSPANALVNVYPGSRRAPAAARCSTKPARINKCSSSSFRPTSPTSRWPPTRRGRRIRKRRWRF